MRTIFKYPLVIQATHRVSMPVGAYILSVANQRGAVTLWAEVDSDEPPEDRTFHVIGTGHPFPDRGRERLIFCGTVVCEPYVWHVYEEV